MQQTKLVVMAKRHSAIWMLMLASVIGAFWPPLVGLTLLGAILGLGGLVWTAELKHRSGHRAFKSKQEEETESAASHRGSSG